MGRRRFLAGISAAAGAAAAGVALGACGGGSPGAKVRTRPRTPPAPPPVAEVTLPSGVMVPSARWLVEENQRPGTIDWVVTGTQTSHALEGYASQVSATIGDEVTLFVSTTARSVRMEAYRMGYYQGLAGRLVSTTDTVAGTPQRPPTLTPGVNTVACPWDPTLTFRVDKTWPPGNYLLKLVGDAGQQQYVPLTVRDDTSTAAFVLQNSVTTWQAYNLWGDYSLYYGRGPTGRSDYAHRARIVSFDRPYPQTWAQGSADFFGNEFPVLYHLEQLGLDLAYQTDVDLHQQPERLVRHRCMFSLGHDEYWSSEMRGGAEAALAAGTNLAVLGANACYRQIRFQASGNGPDRQQICYKDAAEDPETRIDPTRASVNWVQAPVSRPESLFIGSTYQSVGANDGLVVTDASSWLFEGCGLRNGQVLPGVVQGEYDRYLPRVASPANTDVFAHSPVARQGNWSDITYYTTPGGGGVLATGMASFVYKLSNTTAFPWNIVPKAIPGVTDVLLRAMENVYGALGAGPASALSPSTGNWTLAYPAPARPGR
jgi:hypothetical protein